MMPQKNIYSLTVFTLVAVFLLSACAPQTESQSPAPSATEPAATADHAVLKTLTVLHPQSPTILNPYLSTSVKDFEPSRIVYEPLAVFNKDGKLIPVLAAEIPSLENGGLPADGKSVTWKLRQDVRWSDGQAFTAADVLFTYAYITDPAVEANITSEYSQVSNIEAPDKFTIKITFKDVNPAWALPFVGIHGLILPQHVFEDYKGANAGDAPANLMPIGTGAYQVTEPGIKPQEVLLLGSQIVKTTKIVFVPNPYYRFPEKVVFDRIVWRGGGTNNEAARLSLQVGTVDVAYELDLVDKATVADLLNGGKGKLVSAFAPGVDRILLNRTDPNRSSADQEYSSLQIPHPLFSDIKVRQAFAYAIDRDAVAALYGANGLPAYTVLVSPPQYQSSKVFYNYDHKRQTLCWMKPVMLMKTAMAFVRRTALN